MSIYDRYYPTLYRGVVEKNEDPENLGRCKVRVPSVHGALTYPIDILPWARPLVLTPVGNDRGSVNIPKVGDIVWVLFEGADRDFPIYLGGTYSEGDIPSLDKDIIDFYIEDTDRISYDRKHKTYTIESGGNSISVSPGGIRIKGNVYIEGSLEATGDVLGGSISLQNHTHRGVHGNTSSSM